MTQASGLFRDLSQDLRTNLPLQDAIRTADLARELPHPPDLKVIDYTMMTDTKAPDGSDILRPITDKIRVLRDESFGEGKISPAASLVDRLSRRL